MAVRIWPKSKLARHEARWFYFFVAPWIIGYLLFTLGPTLATLYFSFTTYDVLNPPQWVGLQNYGSLFNDFVFWASLRVTIGYTLLSVPLGIIFSLALALLLNQNVPALGIFRTLFYLPAILPSVAVTLLFQWLLNPAFGAVNYIIRSVVGTNGLIPLGINGPGWFSDPNWNVPGYTLLSLWGVGASMLIYLSGLQGVPTALYEAATIDGAGYWKRFWHVTLPMISPVILFTFITSMIASFQVFTQSYIVSAGTGQPDYASMFYVLYLFLNAFRNFAIGLASAQAWILFVVILALTGLFLWVSNRFVYYESET